MSQSSVRLCCAGLIILFYDNLPFSFSSKCINTIPTLGPVRFAGNVTLVPSMSQSGRYGQAVGGCGFVRALLHSRRFPGIKEVIMRLPPLITALAALIALVIVVSVGARFIRPNRSLLADANLSLAKITPNGAGIDEATTISYAVSRNAKVTIAFTNVSSGQRFVFRNAEERAADTYQVLFSGVVNGYTMPGDPPGGDIEARNVPNGDYTWAIEAVADDNGEKQSASGILTVAEADMVLPAITDFSISPPVFTPNQDGINDRVNINLSLAKAAALTVYLEDKGQQHRYYVPEREEGRKPGEQGAHYFDYDGGVDNNVTPPPDGDYTVVALAEDSVGQRVRRTGTVTLKDGGLPNAEIAAQTNTGGTVFYATAAYKDSYFTDSGAQGETISLPQGISSALAAITMPQNDMLVFRLTVSNYGSTSLRTVGPWPGTVYQYNQQAPAGAAGATDGAWRVGIDCEGTETQLPWRWAIGAPDQLTKVDHNGETFWYLPPGKEAVVWGAVRMTRLIKSRNPQECWAALIHEGVIIPPLQSHVGPIKVTLNP